jgi:hypothetical protein
MSSVRRCRRSHVDSRDRQSERRYGHLLPRKPQGMAAVPQAGTNLRIAIRFIRATYRQNRPLRSLAGGARPILRACGRNLLIPTMLDWTHARMRTMHIGLNKHARNCHKTTPQQNDVGRVGAKKNSTIWTLQIVGVVIRPASDCRTLKNRRTGLRRSRSLGGRRVHDRWRLCCRVTGRRSSLSRRKV